MHTMENIQQTSAHMSGIFLMSGNRMHAHVEMYVVNNNFMK